VLLENGNLYDVSSCCFGQDFSVNTLTRRTQAGAGVCARRMTLKWKNRVERPLVGGFTLLEMGAKALQRKARVTKRQSTTAGSD